MNLQSIAEKFIQMLPQSDSGQTMPMPAFVLANQITAKWNGLAIWDGRSETSTIKIQKRISKDERSLERIVAHEICHVWCFWKAWLGESPRNGWHRGHNSNDGWAEAAKIVNQKMGDGFVTENSDETYVELNEKQFYVYAERSPSGYFWAWFSRVTDTLALELRRRITYAVASDRPCALFKTADARFLLPGSKLPRVSRYAEMPDDMVEILDRVMLNNRLTDDDPRDIKTLVGQAKVAKAYSPRSPIRLVR